MSRTRFAAAFGAIIALATVGGAWAGSKSPQATPILTTELLSAPAGRGEGLSAGLRDQVWTDGKRQIWFRVEGGRQVLGVVDESGWVNPAATLSRAAQRAASASLEGAGADHTSRLDSAYQDLPAGQIDVLDLKRGAILQERTGKFGVLQFAQIDPQGRLIITATPDPSKIGRYFPERPGLWSRVTRWIASRLPWVAPPLLKYARAPTPWLQPHEAEAADFVWPFDLVLHQGGEKGWRFFAHVGEEGWRLDRGAIFSSTGLPQPAGPADHAAIQRLQSALAESANTGS